MKTISAHNREVNLLRCWVKPLDSDEVLILFRDSDDREVSGIFPKTYLFEGLLHIDIIEARAEECLITVKGMQCGGYGFFQGSNHWIKKGDIA